ncbi:MAG: shikimate kinase [Lachnospiraceae bacterium]|nr:shikimate kinase [Lachnospiraceae bacterium]
MNYNIMLIGFMGTGKTTVSRELSKSMNIKEVDMDSYIVKREGMSINDIFDNKGEEYFRNVETECLKEIQKEKGRIVSCGGGAVLKDENVKYMKDGGVIVLLTATPETVYNRVKNGKERPILNGHMNVEYISELMEKRKQRYLDVADIKIVTDGKTPVNICNEIVQSLDKLVKNS